MDKEIELADTNTNSKNWKGIAISLLVIVVVILLVVVAAIIKQQNKGIHLEQKAFSIDDILDKRFDPKRFNGVWVNNHQFTYLSEQLNIIKFDCHSQSHSMLLSNNIVKTLVGDKFKYFSSGDINVLLFAYDMKQVFRHSIVSRYKLYNILSNMSFNVVPPNIYGTDQIQNAQLSPNSRKLAFVYQNNIFLKQKYFDGLDDSTQITNDGLELTIYNGITDWLYEEEILYQTNAMWWSPNSMNLAYMKFNDSNVEYFVYPTYDGSPYTYLNKVRYPKPDTPNPTVKVMVYQTEFDQTIELRVPRIVKQSFGDYYVWNVKWLSDDAILLVYVNRKQNSAIIAKNDASTGAVLFEKDYPSPPSRDSDPWFLPSGLITSSRINNFFQIWPFQGYRNIISFDTRNGEAHAITSHQFDVSDLVFFNEKTTTIYYLATNGDPKQRHLFKKNVLDESSSPKCLTCNSSVKYPTDDPAKYAIRLNNSENCLFYSASFSTEGEYYVLECLGDKIPVVYLKSENKPALEYVLESNDELQHLLATRFLPKKSYMRVMLNESANQYADAELLYPNNFDPNENIYPVLVYLYNGPSSQTVDFQFRVRKFETFICINFGVIVAVIDGRGTDFNGDKFLKAVNKRLGEFEIADQLTLINRLKKEVYTDDDRFSIWGWSYGGYLAAAALFQENSPFKCAISGAPVTDWLYYDTAYTERYLGSYAENREAYERANLTSLAKRNSHLFGRKRMMLIHGTGDDNVHFQNSAMLAKILRNTKLDFEFEVYPDVQHTPDDDTQRHLYQKLSKFLLNCYNMNYQHFYEQLNYHHLIGELHPPNKEEEKD